MVLTDEQVKAIDELDAALCQFLNNAADSYDPNLWVPSIINDFKRLGKAYDKCHSLKVMDLRYPAYPYKQG